MKRSIVLLTGVLLLSESLLAAPNNSIQLRPFVKPVTAVNGQSIILYQFYGSEYLDQKLFPDQQIKRVTLYYRLFGSSHFQSVPIYKNAENLWVLSLKSEQVRAPGIDYYWKIETRQGEVFTEPSASARYNPHHLAVLKADEVEQQAETLLAEEKVSVDEPMDGRGELSIRGNASLNYGGNVDSGSDSASDSINGNLHVEADYKRENFSLSFSGVNVNYIKSGSPEVALSSGYLLDAAYQKEGQEQKAELGDVNMDESALIASGYARRGLKTDFNGESWGLRLYDVRSNTVDGWESGLSFDDRQTYGVAYEQLLGEDDAVSLQLTAVSGELKADQSVNVGGQSGGEEGDSASVLLSTELLETIISMEYASSEFDADISDGKSAESDQAYNINLARDFYSINTAFGYQYYGSQFASIANPGFSNDRSSTDFSVGSSYKFLSWSGVFSRSEDNVDHDSTRPRVRSDNTGLNVGISYSSWPSFQVGINHSAQKDQDFQLGLEQVDNINDSFSIGLSKNFGLWSLNWNASLGDLSDRLVAGNDTKTRSNTLTAALDYEKYSFVPNLSRNETITDLRKDISDLAVVSLNLPLFTDDFVVSSQLSYQENSADDDSTDSVISGGSVRFSWSLSDVSWVNIPEWSDMQFGVSANYQNVEDNLVPENDTEESAVFLTFGLGVPYNFDNSWRL